MSTCIGDTIRTCYNGILTLECLTTVAPHSYIYTYIHTYTIQRTVAVSVCRDAEYLQ